MKQLLFLLTLFFSVTLYAQKSDTTVTLIVKFDINSATKDGFYIKDYVVDIDREKAKKFDGRKIKITGKVTIVKGLNNKTKSNVIKQGRAEDKKHIFSPQIEILVE